MHRSSKGTGGLTRIYRPRVPGANEATCYTNNKVTRLDTREVVIREKTLFYALYKPTL